MLSENSFEYNGTQITPDAVVMDGSEELDSSQYTLTYDKGRTNAGVYTVTATLKDNYDGCGTAEFRIEPKELSPDVELTTKEYTFNGRQKTPGVSVTYGQKRLKDYDVIYPSGRTDVGTYTVKVNLKGNYTGSGRATFCIYKINSPMQISYHTVRVDGKKLQKGDWTVPISKILTVRDAKGAVTYTKLRGNNNISIENEKLTIKKELRQGVYQIVVNVFDAGDTNHTMKSLIATMKIVIE